jgi:hypothetical protein
MVVRNLMWHEVISSHAAEPHLTQIVGVDQNVNQLIEQRKLRFLAVLSFLNTLFGNILARAAKKLLPFLPVRQVIGHTSHGSRFSPITLQERIPSDSAELPLAEGIIALSRVNVPPDSLAGNMGPRQRTL